MSPRTALALAILLAVAACGDRKRPARPPSRPVAATPARTAPVQRPQAEEWTYNSVGKRDPFRSFLGDIEAMPRVESKCTTPLGRFELEQLRLVAVITGLDDPVAMVEAPNGVGYALRRGACIGRNGGVIAAVRTGEVVIAESILKPDGTREKTDTLLRLPKDAVLNIEE